MMAKYDQISFSKSQCFPQLLGHFGFPQIEGIEANLLPLDNCVFVSWFVWRKKVRIVVNKFTLWCREEQDASQTAECQISTNST